MKKILWILALLPLMMIQKANATYTILRDASSLSRGLLPNARLDPSSVTLQGNAQFTSHFNSLDSSTASLQAQINNITVAPSSGGVESNLIVTTTSVAGQLSITADRINIMGVDAINVSTTIDMAKTGTGGLDQSYSTVAIWSSYWAITDSSGTKVSIIFSSSSGSVPNLLPSGYTKFQRLGFAYGGAAKANMTPFYKRGRQVTYKTLQNALTSSNPSSSKTNLDISGLVSPQAFEVTFHVVWSVLNTGTCGFYLAPSESSIGGQDNVQQGFGDGVASNKKIDLFVTMSIANSFTFQYADQSSAAAGTGDIDVVGYKENW